jgi:hypothetical protein
MSSKGQAMLYALREISIENANVQAGSSDLL